MCVGGSSAYEAVLTLPKPDHVEFWTYGTFGQCGFLELNRSQVASLVAHLTAWLETGKLDLPLP
jgi:hypothetical protein